MPYAAEESPSQDSTPSASGLDSRWFFSCSVTSGGPSTRRLTEYQNPSGGSAAVMSTTNAAISASSRLAERQPPPGRVGQGPRGSKVRDHWHRR